jgi:hypothetical protein
MLHGAKDRREGKNLTTKNAEITKVKKDTDDRNNQTKERAGVRTKSLHT